jgi:predicted DNA-binding protein (UPF0251 family)
MVVNRAFASGADGRYSNPEIVSRLQRLLADQSPERTSDRTVRSPRKQTQVRLTNEELDVVVVAYESDLTPAELASSFGADRRTLANRLEQRGIPRRSRRLTDQQIDEAAALYNQGWSLARIGGTSASTRRASATGSTRPESFSARDRARDGDLNSAVGEHRGAEQVEW